MKIKATRAFLDGRQLFKKGQEAEVESARAKALIAHGLAVEIKTVKKTEKKVVEKTEEIEIPEESVAEEPKKKKRKTKKKKVEE